jgi:hypothetical protein
LALPRIGLVKAGRILADCGIAPTKTLGGLTERTELINRIRDGGHDKYKERVTSNKERVRASRRYFADGAKATGATINAHRATGGGDWIALVE